MMTRIILLLLAVLLVGALSPLWASIPNGGRTEPVPTPEQKRATGLITHFITRYHYKKTPLDDALSATILERYLESLDPNRSYFLTEDLAAFAAYKNSLDDSLRKANLEPAFEIFRLFRKRLAERMSYTLSLLDRDFNFEIDEDYGFDRSEAPWPADRAELDEIWRKRVKNDVLGLRLTGKSENEIRETLRKRYERLARRTDQLNAEDIYQLFMNAYTISVEPHTAYFSPHTSENFKIRMSLSLEGIGAELQSENEHTVVRRIIPGGPADQSDQLQAEDRIIGVAQEENGASVDVIGWRLDDVVDLIRGPKGSVVRLQILPKGTTPEGPTKVITLVRNKIKLEEQAAQKSMIESPLGEASARIGVIDIPTFYMDFAARARGDEDYRSTTRDVRRLLAELEDEGVDGIIIDLRGNGGGSLAEATELTGLFIESGPIVQVKDASGRIQVNQDPDPGIAYAGPLAVLVDRHSASASEIFAGAIQDYRRGIVIGEPTYGKGTVQSLVDLDRYAERSQTGLGQLKVTIAQFFRINGGSTQHRGIVPDIVFPTAFDSADQGERALKNALPWATVQPAKFMPRTEFGDALAGARARHENRIKTDPGFRYLLAEARSEQEVTDTKRVTLLETRRRMERNTNEKARQERENQFRIALGLEPLGEDEANGEQDETNGEQDEEHDERLSDILLNETAHILADLIDTTRPPPATLQTAGKNPANIASP